MAALSSQLQADLLFHRKFAKFCPRVSMAFQCQALLHEGLTAREKHPGGVTRVLRGWAGPGVRHPPKSTRLGCSFINRIELGGKILACQDSAWVILAQGYSLAPFLVPGVKGAGNFVTSEPGEAPGAPAVEGVQGRLKLDQSEPM